MPLLQKRIRRIDELLHGPEIGRQRQSIAVSHQEAIKAWEGSVIAFLDDAVEFSVSLFGGLVDQLDGKRIQRIEMIAGYDGPGIDVFDILFTFDGFDYHSLRGDDAAEVKLGSLKSKESLGGGNN